MWNPRDIAAVGHAAAELLVAAGPYAGFPALLWAWLNHLRLNRHGQRLDGDRPLELSGSPKIPPPPNTSAGIYPPHGSTARSITTTVTLIHSPSPAKTPADT